MKLPASDKLIHFFAGFGIFFAALWFCQSFVTAFVWVAVFATLKEVRDQIAYGGFDWKDLVATVAGSVAGYVLALLKQ